MASNPRVVLCTFAVALGTMVSGDRVYQTEQATDSTAAGRGFLSGAGGRGRPAAAPARADGGSSAKRVCTSSSSGRRVVSVADLHGDFEAMILLLKRLNIVGERVGRDEASWEGAWVGDDAVLVQTGDILDRGADGRIMYKFLWALQDQAENVGGEVFLLLGNHELLILQGVFDYVGGREDACSYTEDFDDCVDDEYDFPVPCKGKPADDDGHYTATECLGRAWAAGGDMGEQLRTRIAAGKMRMALELGGLVWVHAGLVPELWRRLQEPEATGVEWINDLVKKIDLADSDSVLVDQDHPQGPAWTRMGLGQDGWTKQRERYLNFSGVGRDELHEIPAAEDDDGGTNNAAGGRCFAVQQALLKAQGTRMIIGHNPRPLGNAEILCGGRLLLTDTYMSVGYTSGFEVNKDYSAARADSTHRLLALETADAPGSEIMQVYAGRGSDDRCRPVGPIVALRDPVAE